MNDNIQHILILLDIMYSCYRLHPETLYYINKLDNETYIIESLCSSLIIKVITF